MIFALAKWLDDLYHRYEWLPLGWACDWYDGLLLGDGPWDVVPTDSGHPLEAVNPYLYRCPVCEGLDYPGLSHNTDAPYCTEFVKCGRAVGVPGHFDGYCQLSRRHKGDCDERPQ